MKKDRNKIYASVLVPLDTLNQTPFNKKNKTKLILTKQKPSKKNPLNITPKLDPNIHAMTNLKQLQREKIRGVIRSTPKYDKRELILNSVTVNKTKITKLVDWLLEKQNIISWDRNRNLILYNTPIPNSNIVNIFRHVYTTTSDPKLVQGAVAFYHALREVDIPPDLIKNKIGAKII